MSANAPSLHPNLARAVNFLRTPSIVASPSTEAKVSFLLTTGLNREEIAVAFELAGQQLLPAKEEKETPRKPSEPPKAAAAGTPDTGRTLPVTPDRNDGHDTNDDDGDDASLSEPAVASEPAEAAEPSIAAAAPPVPHVRYLSSDHRSNHANGSFSSSASSCSSWCSSVSSDGDGDDRDHSSHHHQQQRGYASSDASGISSAHQPSWKEAARFPGRTKLARLVAGRSPSKDTGGGSDDEEDDDKELEEYRPLPVDYSGVTSGADNDIAGGAAATDDMIHCKEKERGGADVSGLTTTAGSSARSDRHGREEEDGPAGGAASYGFEEGGSDDTLMDSVDLGSDAVDGIIPEEASEDDVNADDAPAQATDDPTKGKEAATDQFKAANLASASRRMLLQIQERRHAALLAREEKEENAKNGTAAASDAESSAVGGNRASRFFARAVRKASRDRVGSAADSAVVEEGMGPTLAAAIAAADEESVAADMPVPNGMNGKDTTCDSDTKPPSATSDEDVVTAVVDLSTTFDTSIDNVRSRADSKMSEGYTSSSELEQCDWLETSSEEGSARTTDGDKISGGGADVEEEDSLSKASVPSKSSPLSSNAGSAPAEKVYGDEHPNARKQDKKIQADNKRSPTFRSDTPPQSECATPEPSCPGEAPSAATETTPEKTPEVSDANRSESLANGEEDHAKGTALAAIEATIMGKTTAAAVATTEGKSPPPTTTPPTLPRQKQEVQGNTPTSSSLGLLISSLRTAATKPPVETSRIPSQEQPQPAIIAPVSTDESLDHKNMQPSNPVATKQKDTPHSPKSSSSRFSKKKKKPVWHAVVDEASGDVYFYNRKTRKTTWDRPEGVVIDDRKRTFPDKSEKVVGAEASTETIVLGGVTSGLARGDARKDADEMVSQSLKGIDATKEILPDPSDKAQSEGEDSLQERISIILGALYDEDKTSYEIRSSVVPPPKRSDESTPRTCDAGIYEGESLPHGFGSMTFSNGNRYVSNWVHGEPSGSGTMYLASGEAKRGRWNNGAFVPFDCVAANDEKYEESTLALLPSSESSSSSSGHSDYEHADDELSAQDIIKVDVSSRRPIDPSGFDRTDDPSACSTLEPSNRNLNDDVPAAADPDQPVEVAVIPERTSVEDIFHQEDRDLEKGETESAMQRRRKRLREKRWWTCVPFLLVFLGAACLGAGIYTWWLFLGPGRQDENSTTSIGSSSSAPGDAFSGPTSIISGEIDSSSRPRDDGSEDVI